MLNVYKATSYIFAILISIIFCSELVVFFQNEGIGGHDNFQYIGWSKVIFTEDKNLSFYRPVLYWIINIFFSFYGWLPESYGILLVYFYFISALCFFILINLRYKNLFLSLFSLLIIYSSPWIVTSFKNTYVNILEFTFIIFFLFSYFFFLQKKNIFTIILFALTGFCLTHIHEDKFILVFFLYFYEWIYCQKDQKRKIYYVISIFCALSIITILYYNPFEILNSILSAGGSAPKTNLNSIIYNFILNVTTPIKDSSSPIFSNIFLILFFAYPFLVKGKKKDFEFVIFLSLISYLIVITLFFGHVQITRVLHPVSPLFIILAIFVIRFFLKNLSVNLRNVMLSLLILIIFNNFYNNTYKNFKHINDNSLHQNHWYESYRFIKNNLEKSSTKIYETSSIENRIPGWGISKNNYYGLSSPVYFYLDSVNSNYMINVKKNKPDQKLINEILETYDVIIFNNLWKENEKRRTSKKLINFDNHLENEIKKRSSFTLKNFKKKNIDLNFYIKDF